MSTATFNTPVSGANTSASREKASNGLFSRIAASMVEAQMSRAERVARSSMAVLPDSQLAELGYTPEQIKEIRQYRGFASYWY